jgi:hypothetical protein
VAPLRRRPAHFIGPYSRTGYSAPNNRNIQESYFSWQLYVSQIETAHSSKLGPRVEKSRPLSFPPIKAALAIGRWLSSCHIFAGSTNKNGGQVCENRRPTGLVQTQRINRPVGGTINTLAPLSRLQQHRTQSLSAELNFQPNDHLVNDT